MVSRMIRVLMWLATMSFVIASLLHFGVALPLAVVTIGGEPFGRAAIPEAIIAVVLVIGSLGVMSRRPAAWWLALTTTLFAILGVLVGLTTIVVGVGPRSPADLGYHITILVALAVIVALLLTPQARRAFAPSQAV